MRDEAGNGALPIVGIGASAGGLEALRALVGAIPVGADVCHVVIQHLSPDHPSIMHQLLSAHTELAVRQIEDGDPVRTDTVYIAPPGRLVDVEGDRFVLSDREGRLDGHLPIDHFFRALAEVRGRDAYCVVLSGTGSDGTEGLKAVKGVGGFAIVQESGGARFPGMPDSAVATGMVDFVLPAVEIPRRIVEIVHHRMGLDGEATRERLSGEIEGRLHEITGIVAEAVGHDFSSYKPGTLVRRIERRMSLLRVGTVDGFLARLDADPEEARRLGQEFLIGVTRFFRDAEAFGVLRERVVVPTLERDRPTVRVWVPGCSTGEEAYSIAMLFLEEMERQHDRRPLQVFGTDIDLPALMHARHGLYGPGAVEKMPPERRDAFFVFEAGQFRAVPRLREACVFAPHNLIQDPPFSRLDLISCRNLMIYLSAELQAQVIPRFHFALREGGHLFLGPSEGLAGEDVLFKVEDRAARIFRRNDAAPTRYTPLNERPRRPMALGEAVAPGQVPPGLEISRETQAEQVFLREHAAPFALVSSTGEVLYLSQAMTRFVRPARGAPSPEIDAYLARDLRVPVRAALAEAVQTAGRIETPNVPAEIEGRRRLFDVAVSPVEGDKRTFLLALTEVRVRDTGALDETLSRREASDRDVLESEVSALRKQLSATLQEAETSSQELKSSNEELLSMNEELQSSNEELETSREELQSINEELETVNAELRENNAQLLRANSDLKNLFEATDAAVLFLDPQMCVRNFTPPTARLFGIKPRDVGRPISDLSSRVAYPELEADAEEVGRTLGAVEREVAVEATGEVYALRIRPYRTTDDRIDGFVLTFFEITSRKRAERELERQRLELARQYGELETLYDTTPVGLALHDRELRHIRINKRLADINGLPIEEHIGRTPKELLPDIEARVEELIRGVLETGEPALGVEIHGTTPADPAAPRDWLGDYYPVFSEGEVFAVGVCVREVTHEKRMLEDITAANEQQRILLGELQHRVRNTLATVSAISRFLIKGADSAEAFQKRLAERLQAMSRTHEALSETNWTTVSLRELLRREARPYGGEADVLRVEGPDVELGPEQALNLGLALHEMMTNAAKYGALSTPDGRIEVRIAREGDGRLRLEWAEAGGPEVSPPQDQGGFGTLLLGRMLGPGLGGEVEIDPRPSGMRYVITF